MSRSVYADQVEQLQMQLSAALSDSNLVKDSLKACHANLDQVLGKLADMTKQRDDARASVASLKEMLHNAELSASRVQGQLDRINQVEEVARIPMEKVILESMRPVREHSRAMTGYTDTAYLRTARDGSSDKHWTSL